MHDPRLSNQTSCTGPRLSSQTSCNDSQLSYRTYCNEPHLSYQNSCNDSRLSYQNYCNDSRLSTKHLAMIHSYSTKHLAMILTYPAKRLAMYHGCLSKHLAILHIFRFLLHLDSYSRAYLLSARIRMPLNQHLRALFDHRMCPFVLVPPGEKINTKHLHCIDTERTISHESYTLSKKQLPVLLEK